MVFYPPSTKLSREPIALITRLTEFYVKDVAYIKRVIGMPGDKLEIKFNKRRFGLRLHKRQKYEEDYIKSIYEFSPYLPN